MKKKSNKKYYQKAKPGRGAGAPVYPRDKRAPSRAHKYAHPGRRGGRNTRREEIVEGIFCGNERGFGFVMPDGFDGDDIFIPSSSTGGAVDGDRVKVAFVESYTGERRREGRVIGICERGRTRLTGVLEGVQYMRGKRVFTRYFVSPDSRRYSFDVLIDDDTRTAEVGDKVEVEFDPDTHKPGYRDRRATVKGYIVRSFGPAGTRGANYSAILCECGIVTEFDRDALAEAEKVAAMPLDDEGRVRRDEVIFTIDGADAKDLDDAVSLSKNTDGSWRLGVHIADVSEYVRPGSALDRAAMSRGTSVYFVDKVVPMLPEALSNGACSLNVGEDKYALSAIITLSPAGEILSTFVERSIIRSRVRGVYSEVNDLFEMGDRSEFAEKYREVMPTLFEMRKLYELLAKRSRARGAIDFEADEACFVLGEDGNIAEILRRERGVAERMIEQFMLAANEGVATLMAKKDLPCVYRIHEPPAPDKLRDFITYAHNLGLDTAPLSQDDVSCADFSAVLDEARERGIDDAVSGIMLRTMAKAKYSEKAKGHFGLGIDLYCHFTSPIRRLSDTATHRMIKAVLLDGQDGSQYRAYASAAAKAASECELRAMDAERKIEDLYKTIYMESFIGEEFPAKIVSITSFGMFCALENTCEGLVSVRDMDGYYEFDERKLTLSRGNIRYHIGDVVTVVVDGVSLSDRRVYFRIKEGKTVDAPQTLKPTPTDTPKPANQPRSKSKTPAPHSPKNKSSRRTTRKKRN